VEWVNQTCGAYPLLVHRLAGFQSPAGHAGRLKTAMAARVLQGIFGDKPATQMDESEEDKH